ncbi:hypothetical protein MTE01_25850 [Microbacterium testaceum]|uniref:Uncharacterized protein n=1 Tax=Microbacterium testaceum TaxID=2033 RepID=A0A4Y3QRE5_MICTE|nr:hypothetical protein [Microbacterium testaceum]GEB46640.1 hypothetical protein MTE01_25850 [Microbacterium testaceum]
MYNQRLDTFIDAMSKSALDAEVSDLVLRLLKLMRSLDDLYESAEFYGRERTAMTELTVANVLGEALDDLRSALTAADDIEILGWVSLASRRIRKVIRGSADTVETVRDLAKLREDAVEISRSAQMLLDQYSITRQEAALKRTLESAEVAASAAEKAQESAGVTGSSSLSTHFDEYAKAERKAAEIFRALAIAGVVGALVAAVAFGPIDSGDWPHLTYRIATVAAVGTLAAYFARQAGQHRRVYNWAKSLEVQLKSFPAFIAPVPEAERGEVYRAFARRVLSAPPEKGIEGAEDSVGAAQLLDLVTVLAKRQ